MGADMAADTSLARPLSGGSDGPTVDNMHVFYGSLRVIWCPVTADRRRACDYVPTRAK